MSKSYSLRFNEFRARVLGWKYVCENFEEVCKKLNKLSENSLVVGGCGQEVMGESYGQELVV